MIFNIMLVSNQSGNITPRLPTCAKTRRHFVEPSSTSSDHHLGKPNKSPASRRRNHHQHRRPTDYTERAYRHHRTVASSSRHLPRHDPHRQGRTVAPSSWCPSRRTTSTHRLASRLRHLGWTGGFIISSSTYSGHFGVTSRPTSSRLAGPRASPRRANLCQHHLPLDYYNK